MGYLHLFILMTTWVVIVVVFIPSSYALQTSQTGVLLQLRKHLEYPLVLNMWGNYNGDFCSFPSTSHVSVTCHDDLVTELKVIGDKVAKAHTDFNGFAVPGNQTLSASFSMDSFITTLTRLTSLRCLNLVSLGIWGNLPDKIHRLVSLEFLDLSSNYFFGSVPAQMSRMVSLKSLNLDGNYFNGTMPYWLDSLSNLTVLSLKGNSLSGHFPSSISKIRKLTDIALSNNKISGKLPDLSSLTSLHVLDLRENRLSSQLPNMPKGLVTILLSKNSFSGEISQKFGNLGQLQHLDVSFNDLSGAPPSILFSLPNISYLNLASNMLSGSLPKNLRCGGKLGFVDISSNRLTGKLPSCLDSLSDKRVVKYGENCFSIDFQHQHHEVYCKDADLKVKQSKQRGWLLVAIIGGSVLVVVLLTLGFVFLWRRRHTERTLFEQHMPKPVPDNSVNGVSSDILANARLISQAVKLGAQGSPACRMFTLEELKEATYNFNSSAFLGEGSLGKLYKGRLDNGTYIAVRSLVLLRKCSVQNLKARLDFLSKIHHPNLVNFMGHCIDGGQIDSIGNTVFLIYEYVPNGNYRAQLSEDYPQKLLKWSDRLAILIGVAKAVHFLHTGIIPGCLNNRLKTNNILLDEHRIPKLSDYGISTITEETEKIEAKVQGQQLSQKPNLHDDVYNFGFILLESLVGPIVSGKGETFLLNEMESFSSMDNQRRIVDPIVLTTCSQESLSIVVSITRKCIHPDPSSRPSFEDVLWNLQYAAQVQGTADTEQKSDSTLSQP
ncbi:hypothetical protein ACFE04_006143 [Oxalis oulophora]